MKGTPKKSATRKSTAKDTAPTPRFSKDGVRRERKNLTIDPRLFEAVQADVYARGDGQSVSDLVNRFFSAYVQEMEKGQRDLEGVTKAAISRTLRG